MDGLYRVGISFCMGWTLRDDNYLGFALIGVCWLCVEYGLSLSTQEP